MSTCAAVLGLAVALSIALNAQGPTTAEQQQHDADCDPQNVIPADYSLVPTGVHAARAIRNEKPYRERIQEPPSRVGDVLTIYNRVETPALPVGWSNAIVMASVHDARSFVTPDKTNVYTEYTITVEDVLGSTAEISSLEKNQLTVEREGGCVRFPSGRFQDFRVSGLGRLKPNRLYILFLGHQPETDDFRAIAAFEINNGRVLAADEEQKYRIYNGKTEQELLSAIRSALAATPLGSDLKR